MPNGVVKQLTVVNGQVTGGTGQYLVTSADMSTTGVTAGSHNAWARTVTVDAAGRVTGMTDATSLFNEAVQDLLSTTLVAGSNVTLTYDDVANTLTVAATGGGGGVTDPQPANTVLAGPESGADAVPTFRALVFDDLPNPADAIDGGPPSPGDNILFGGSSWQRATAEELLDLITDDQIVAALGYTPASGSHTHAAADVTDFAEAVDDRVSTLLVAGTNVTLTYDDGSNTLTVDAAGGGDVTQAGDHTFTGDNEFTGVVAVGGIDLAGPVPLRLLNVTAIVPDRTLSFNVTDLDPVLTVAGDATVSGTNTGDQFTNTTASRLVGRGSASGDGEAQEIVLGNGLAMSGTTLSARAFPRQVANDSDAANGELFWNTTATALRYKRPDGTVGTITLT